MKPEENQTRTGAQQENQDKARCLLPERKRKIHDMKTKYLRKLARGVGLSCIAPWLALSQSTYEPYTFSTIAGMAGVAGSANGTNAAARFNFPLGVAVDSAGNLYVSDYYDYTIRKMAPVGTNWVVTTLVGKAGVSGSADGTNSAARFNGPDGVAIDRAGSVYVADGLNNTIRKMTPIGTNWVVSTLAGRAGFTGSADGTNSAARFNWPLFLAMDGAGNLYVADVNNNTIRKVTPFGTNWVVTTLVGMAGMSGSADGTNSAARFNLPACLGFDGAGNLYVPDYNNNTIRKVTPVGTNWVVSTLAGRAGFAGSADGTNSVARFKNPHTTAADAVGNIYVTDCGNNTIRKLTPVGTNWVVTTLAGQAGISNSADGTGRAAQFVFNHGPGDYPDGSVAVDSSGHLYVTEPYKHTIHKGYRPVTLSASSASLGFSSGGFNVAITGPAGQTVVMDISTDLVSWLPLWTNTFMVGPLQFCDPDCGTDPQRFYRAHLQ